MAAVQVLFLVLLMALIALLEGAVPYRERGPESTGRSRANLALTASTFLLNWGLGLAGAALLMAPTSWLRIVLGVIALDAFAWLAHYAMHHVPALWRLHRVHHADPFVDVTTTFRQHPLETVWRAIWTIGPAWALGVPATGLVIYRLLSATNALLEHANVRLHPRLERVLSWVWVTPGVHKLHHSAEQTQTDTNFGNLLSVPDRLLGTFTPPEQPFGAYGLTDIDPQRARSLPALLGLPLTGTSGNPQ